MYLAFGAIPLSYPGMSDEIHIRREGRAGRITLNRTRALNALTLPMIQAILDAITAWATDRAVHLIVIDAAGDRAFCAGGDLAALYAAGQRGDYDAGRHFWQTEYRMNLAIATSVKPVVTLMQGYVMGGGVGLGCHAALRITDPDATFALPETKIGLIPDAGGSWLLAHAPGRMGEYLGSTGSRFGAADAVWLGLADRLIPDEEWPALIARLCKTGRTDGLPMGEPPHAQLAAHLDEVNAYFAGETLKDIIVALAEADTPFAQDCLTALADVSPLAAAAAVEMMHRLDDQPTLPQALDLEYRFAFRAQEKADLLQGIRAMVIDKDRNPTWRHSDITEVTETDVARLLAPLGEAALKLEG